MMNKYMDSYGNISVHIATYRHMPHRVYKYKTISILYNFNERMNISFSAFMSISCMITATL